MPRIRDGGWLRSLDRRLDDLEAEGPVGIPWDEVLSRIRWYHRGRGLLVAVGVGLRPGDRLAELVFSLLHQRPPPWRDRMCGWRSGSRFGMGPGSGRTRAQRCQSSRSIRPRLKNLCAHWEENLFHPRPALASGARTPGCCGVVLVLLGRLPTGRRDDIGT